MKLVSFLKVVVMHTGIRRGLFSKRQVKVTLGSCFSLFGVTCQHVTSVPYLEHVRYLPTCDQCALFGARYLPTCDQCTLFGTRYLPTCDHVPYLELPANMWPVCLIWSYLPTCDWCTCSQIVSCIHFSIRNILAGTYPVRRKTTWYTLMYFRIYMSWSHLRHHN